MNIKAIVVDLDRTLLHTDKTISAYTKKILQECKKNSIKIMVATARPQRNTIPYCEQIGFDAVVVSNGARILYGDQRTEYNISSEIAVYLLTTLSKNPDMRITVETGDCAYSNKRIEDYETVITDDLIEIAKREGVLKILVHLDHKDTLEIIKQVLPKELYYTIANGYLLQIMSKHATKWNGIQEMLARVGCSPIETMYFGDDHDDIESLKMCGVGVAVSNAIEEAKEAADYIAESNDADGVAKFIDNMIVLSL